MEITELTLNNCDGKDTVCTVARSIGECVGHIGRSNQEEVSWSMRPLCKADNARVIRCGWLSPGDRRTRSTKVHGLGDVINAGDNWWDCIHCNYK